MVSFISELAQIMRNWLPIVVFFLASGLLHGQVQSRLTDYLETSGTKSEVNAQAEISELLSKLNSKPRKSDRIFLKSVFSLTHRQLLKTYQQYADFSEIFNGGRYDCVTATALYSLLLEELGYSHAIYETKYHVFLLVESSEGQFLIESTDPINGFEYQKERIKERSGLG